MVSIGGGNCLVFTTWALALLGEGSGFFLESTGLATSRHTSLGSPRIIRQSETYLKRQVPASLKASESESGEECTPVDPPNGYEKPEPPISKCLWAAAGDLARKSMLNHNCGPALSDDAARALGLPPAKRQVLVLCTGGTITMASDAAQGGGLAPVKGALDKWMAQMEELKQPEMPCVTIHEYTPLMDSSDMGPPEWARLATDIETNYLNFDGFVVLTGTDTMAYAASALSFMLENLGKPVIFTGSQIPLSQAYNDARRNLIMSLIFASRDSVSEVAIFFQDRLLRGCRATKVDTHRLQAFDSPNLPPLATIGITVDEADHLLRPQPKGQLRVHTKMDTRLLAMRLVPGFDDQVLKYAVEQPGSQLRALVLQLYGAGNLPSAKRDLIETLERASARGILVVATTQCLSGSVNLGMYAVGQGLAKAGVVSGGDMTVEAACCKLAYLFGRGDLSNEDIARLMPVSLRGEITPLDQMKSSPFAEKYRPTTAVSQRRRV